MFKKIFEYAGPYKKNMYVATVVVLVSVLMGILPFVLAYQVISPLVMGDSVETEFVLLRVIGVLICLVLQAFFYGWGLSISHKVEMSRNVQSGNTQNLKSSAAPVRLPAAPASTPGTSQAAAQAGCVYRP